MPKNFRSSASASHLMVRLLLAIGILCLAATSAAAQTQKTYSKTGSFEDVKFDLGNAIVSAGLKIDFNGMLGQMLDRTGADVGSTKPIYKHAEFYTFCSARLSRLMMEADPDNIAHCPFVMFIYEPAEKPGSIKVGYRRLPGGGSPANQASHDAINALLDGIARGAIK